MSDYATMQSRIADELSKSNLTNQIKSAIQSAIKHYQKNHFWFNEATGTFSTANATEYYAVVTTVPDYLEIDSATITVNSNKYRLNLRPNGYIDAISGNTSLTGVPEDYSVYKQNLRFYPIPNGTYTVTLSYIKKLDALSSGTDTNAWMVEGEELIRSRAKADIMLNLLKDYEGYRFMKAQEKEALDRLEYETTQKISTGAFVPTCF